MVQGFMKNKLGLKGTKRDIYAIIYGFSQDSESWFTGSLSYLINWLDVSKPTVIKALQELVEQDLIIKRVESINGVTFNRYKANLEILQGVKNFNGGSKEILLGGSKEILPNNIINNNKNYNKEKENIKEKCIEVLDYLNQKAKTYFRQVESNLKFISARLNDYSVDDLKKVIDKKVKEWKGTEMQKYLRPETLFSSVKFENYLNGLEAISNNNSTHLKINDYTSEELNAMYDNLDEIEI